MLILTGKSKEEIHVGDDVKIVILRTSSGSVKIGINAPKSVGIRHERKPQRNARTVKEPNDL